MNEVKYNPGQFCWIECATTDPTASKKLYTELLGWKTHDDSMPDGAVYTMLMIGDAPIGGLYKMPAEMVQMGAPPHWNSHIAVADADVAAKKAKELGATILKDAFDVVDLGRMAVIQDPVGATFSVWQAKKHGGAAKVAEDAIGRVTWYEAMTTNVDRTVGFYTKLFGWTPSQMPMGDKPYTAFMHGGQPIGGVYPIDAEMQKMGAHPNWMVYFAVKDCDQSVAQAKKLGCDVKMAMDIPTVGKVAIIVDPLKCAFAIHQPAPQKK